MKSQALVRVVIALSALLLPSTRVSARTGPGARCRIGPRYDVRGAAGRRGGGGQRRAHRTRALRCDGRAGAVPRIVDLRPGLYTLTFTLPGFSTVKRDGVQLSVGITANVSVELAVGDVQETITVSGAAPLVDIQNVSQQRVVTREILDNLPTAKTIQNMAVLTPGVVVTGGMFGASSQDVAALRATGEPS